MRVPCPGSVSCSATSNEMRLRSIAPSQRFLSIGCCAEIQRPAPLIKTPYFCSRLIQTALKPTASTSSSRSFAGEAFFAPIEGTAEGEIVGSISDIGKLDTPVRLVVQKGIAKVIADCEAARKLGKQLSEVGRKLGNNSGMGGTVSVAIHFDDLVQSATLYVDDVLILKSGSLRI